MQLSQNSRVRVSHIADTLNISERAARRVIVDLEEAGYLRQYKKGRYAIYAVENRLTESLLALKQKFSSLLNRLSSEISENSDSKRVQVSQQLLSASYNLMDAGKSFWELSIDELIAVAGIGRSTFYAYFEDKSTLLEIRLKELLEEMWQASVQMLNCHLMPPKMI